MMIGTHCKPSQHLRQRKYCQGRYRGQRWNSMSHVETKLRKLEEQVATAYKNFSIVGEVCTLREVPSDIRQGKFTQFASNILIEKAHIVDPAHFLILSEIGTSVARDEMNFLVKRLSQLLPKNTVDEISFGSIKQ